jgi:HlyD family secretion protein
MKPQRILIGGLVLAAVSLVSAIVLVPRLTPPHLLSGYVEGEPLYLAAPVSGSVAELSVQRGDRVVVGQALFSIDPRQVSAQRAQAEAEVTAASAAAQDVRRGLRPTELAVYDANILAAEARLREANASLSRIAPLARRGIYAPARLDDAQAAVDTARAQLSAARRQRDSATLGGREGQVESADSRSLQAIAALDAAEARLGDLAPRAPVSGLVEDVFFQTGEWAPANQPVLAILPDDRIRLRFFVPQAALSAYRVGGTVHFACDGCAAGMTAKISFISPRPEFTPPIIYSREARDRLVYLVEAMPSARLNPGQPIDVQPLEPGT